MRDETQFPVARLCRHFPTTTSRELHTCRLEACHIIPRYTYFQWGGRSVQAATRNYQLCLGGTNPGYFFSNSSPPSVQVHRPDAAVGIHIPVTNKSTPSSCGALAWTVVVTGQFSALAAGAIAIGAHSRSQRNLCEAK